MDEIDDPRHRWKGCASESDLQRQFEHLNRLYERLAEDGFHTQRELCRRGRIEPKNILDQLKDEITVDVGRDGQLLFVDGRHRLSIAKLLDVDAVPVVVYARHERWMEERLERLPNPLADPADRTGAESGPSGTSEIAA